MRIIPAAVSAAIASGAWTDGAAWRFVSPSGASARLWSGQGLISIGGEPFTGVGAQGLITAVSTLIGGAAGEMTLELSGVDPEAADALTSAVVRDAVVTGWRLVFDAAGERLLGVVPGPRGRASPPERTFTPGGAASLRVSIEGGAAGLGSGGGRMRADADQRLISGSDGGMRHVSYAGSVELSWGGKPAARASAAIPGAGGPTTYGSGGGGRTGGGMTGGTGLIV